MIEDHITSLDLSKRLAEIGVPQNSLFYWVEDIEAEKQPCAIISAIKIDNIEEQYSSFLASELLEIIKAHIRISKDVENGLIISVYYQPEYGTDNSYTFTGTNLADLLGNVILAQNIVGEFNKDLK